VKEQMKSLAPKPLSILFLCMAFCLRPGLARAQTSGFPDLGHIGPSNAQIVGIFVGAGIVIGVVVYLVIPKHKTIEGCVQTSDEGLQLMSDQGKQIYAVRTDGVPLQPGRRFKLKGKQGKKKSGTHDFRVTKLVKDEGLCSEHP
jgi:hypothetical protein